MGIFDIFKKPKRENYKHAQMLNGFTPIFSQFGKDIYASDAVRQAVACIASELKKLDPQHVIRKNSDITPVYDEVQAVLQNPNSLMTTADMLEKIVWQLYLNYNAFVLPVWEGNKLKELYPIQPVQVDFLQDASEEYFVKLTFANNYNATIKYSDIIHIRYEYGINEFMGGGASGQPDHKALLKTLELNNTMLEGVAKGMKSSFAINGVVKYNTMLDAAKTEKALEELTRALQNNDSGFLPLDMKGEFIPFKHDPKLVDADTLRFLDEKILRNFGVSLPILTGDYTKEQYEAFYQKTLEPLIKTLSQAFTKCLFSRRESFGFGHEIMFYPKDLIFLTTTQKLEMIRLLGDSGGLMENEKRTLMGLKPLKELEGVRLQSLNYVSADIANTYQLEGQPTTAAPPTSGATLEGGAEVTEAVADAVEEVQDIKKEPLLVGQIQALSEIIAGYQAGTYSYNQAKNMLIIGVGLTDEEAERLLDKQDEPIKEVIENDKETQ